MMDTVLFIIQWLIAPVAAFVWMMHIKVSRHNTDIAVLKSQIMSDKLAHDREMKDVKEALRSIAAKLDSIDRLYETNNIKSLILQFLVSVQKRSPHKF